MSEQMRIGHQSKPVYDGNCLCVSNSHYNRIYNLYFARGKYDCDVYSPCAIFICHPATGTIEERMKAREAKEWEQTIAEVEFYSKCPLNL